MYQVDFVELKSDAREQVYPWDEKLVDRAFQIAERAHAGQYRVSSEPYICHPLEVARILANLQCDLVTFLASLLHDVVEDSDVKLSTIEQEFGHQVAFLVEALTKFGRRDFEGEQRRQRSLRKLLVGMAHDIRIAYIKLADRLHNLRTLMPVSDQMRRRVAQETLEFFAPLAEVIGINLLKTDLREFALRALEPETYQLLHSALEEQAQQDLIYLDQVSHQLDKALREYDRLRDSGVQVFFFPWRPKASHLYEMISKPKSAAIADEVRRYSLVLQVWIQAQSPRGIDLCYPTIAAIHRLWPPIHQCLRDYIAAPKFNGYQAIHTVVVGPSGKKIEFQVSTNMMHQASEYGPLSRSAQALSDQGVAKRESLKDLARIIEVDQYIPSTEEFLTFVRRDILAEKIRVFSMRGDSLWLPVDSTPIDFAYCVDEMLGHRCERAMVDGYAVPLNQKLSDGNQVEIIPRDTLGPRPEWRTFVRTAYALQKINKWLGAEFIGTDSQPLASSVPKDNNDEPTED